MSSIKKISLKPRVILMSATIDTTLFSSYYGSCPVLEVGLNIEFVQK